MGPTAQATHDAVWINKHLPSSVQLRDVTSQYTVLAVMGPQSRLLLEQVTDHPLDNHNFPFGTSQVICGLDFACLFHCIAPVNSYTHALPMHSASHSYLVCFSIVDPIKL